jgi:alanine dehydrogenase
VAAKLLARPGSRRVGLIGCGAQADAQLLALAEVMRVRQVKVWGFASGEAARFCRRMRRLLPLPRYEPCASVRACARDVDVLVTLTPSRRPLVRREWISPGTHINAVGADAPGKQELDARILRDAIVVVDERMQSVHGGELNVPVSRRQYSPSRIAGDLGQLLIKRPPFQRPQRAITVFDSTGLAIHDVALAAALLKRANRLRAGKLLQLDNAAPAA